MRRRRAMRCAPHRALRVACVIAAIVTPLVAAFDACGDDCGRRLHRLEDLLKLAEPPLVGAFCVTKLSATTAIGCSTMTNSISHVIERVHPLGENLAVASLGGDRVVVATPAAFLALARDVYGAASDDDDDALEVRARIKGILVETLDVSDEEEKAWTGASGFANASALWARAATMDFRGVPMMLLDRATTLKARERVAENAKQFASSSSEDKARSVRLWSARINERMDGLGKRPKTRPPTSMTCLALGTCLPIGGYSVVATVPPLRDALDAKSVIVVMARLDSDGMFRDAAYATNARVSGLTTMLAMANALGSALSTTTASDESLAHPVVFMALSGEDFGALGVDRVTREWNKAAAESDIPGLAGRKIRAVIELGALGLASERYEDADADDGAPTSATVYAHGGEAAEDFLSVMRDVASADDYLVSVENGVDDAPSDRSERVIPITLKTDDYVYAYVSENPTLTALDALAGSPLDFGFERSVNYMNMRDAVDILSKSVLDMALSETAATSTSASIDRDAMNEAVVPLMRCLLDDAVGLSRCTLGKDYVFGEDDNADVADAATVMNITTRYPDVLLGIDADAQAHESKNAFTRFVWNYLAAVTASATSSATSTQCENDGTCASSNAVCVGKTASSVGACVDAAPRYVLALSTRLRYDGSTGAWSVKDAEDDFERAAPLWTESNWQPDIGGVLHVDPTFWDNVWFASMTLASLLCSWFVTRASNRARAIEDDTA